MIYCEACLWVANILNRVRAPAQNDTRSDILNKSEVSAFFPSFMQVIEYALASDSVLF